MHINNFMKKYKNMTADEQKDYEKVLVRKMVTEQINDNTAIELSVVWMEHIFGGTKNYKVITNVVYQTNLEDLEDEEVYVANIDRLISKAEELSLLSEENAGEKYRKSLYNHFGLAIEQKEFITDNIDNLKESIKIAESNVEKIKDTKGKIYTEFVTILGIFTTIMFAVFGGFQGIGLIGMNINETPISKLIMFFSLMMIGIGFLIFLSYNAVSKLTNLDLSSCGCENKKSCDCRINKRHPTLFYSTILFSYLFLGSIAVHIYKYQSFTLTNGFSTILAGVILLLLGISIIIVICNRDKLFKI